MPAAHSGQYYQMNTYIHIKKKKIRVSMLNHKPL